MTDLEKRVLELELKMKVVETVLKGLDKFDFRKLEEDLDKEFKDIHKFVTNQFEK